MMEKPLISVIVPCYNMERFLKRSVESLLATDYEEKEIILVNDGSSDSTRQIIDSYCSRYQCIKGVHKSNRDEVDVDAASCCISINYWGAKRVLPVWLLKKRLYRVLYMLLKVAHRLNISANEWG